MVKTDIEVTPVSTLTPDKLDNVAVIIRAADERTEALCADLAARQVLADHVTVLHERPFSRALRKGFEVGLDYGLEWTLCLDADTLLVSDAIPAMLDEVKDQPETLLGGHGYVLDKLFGDQKFAGYHLYQTALLKQALPLVPDAALSLRPETDVKDAMAERGHTWVKFKGVYALHDYEQYYRDLYRKMVVRANKSPEWAEGLLKRFEFQAALDRDFLVAAWGLRVGMRRDDEIRLDAEQWRSDAETLLLAHNIDEKAPLEVGPQTWALPDECVRAHLRSRQKHFQTKSDRGGIAPSLRKAVWLTGWMLGRAGNRLQRAAGD